MIGGRVQKCLKFEFSILEIAPNAFGFDKFLNLLEEIAAL